MTNIEDDATPLLYNFIRNSSFRVPVRKKAVADLFPRARPPLPPRFTEFDRRTRSQSITEGEENWAPGTFPRLCGKAQILDGKGCATEHRIYQPCRNTQAAYSSRPTTQSEDESHTNDSSVSSYQRNGYLSASLPLRRKAYGGFFSKLSSPLASRRAKAQAADIPAPDLDVAHREMPTTSYRKPQVPPKPNNVTLTEKQPQRNITTHQERNNIHNPQQTRSDFVGRSTSFRQQRSSYLSDGFVSVPTHQVDRPGNNIPPSPREEHNSRWDKESHRRNHKDLGSDKPIWQRGIRRYSSLPRPEPAYRDNTVEPHTHSRLPSPMTRGGDTSPSIIRPTTPTTPTGSPISPRSFRRSDSWNPDVRSTCHLSRVGSSRESNSGGGNNKDDGTDSYFRRVLSSSSSSDSGYSSTSVSRRSSTISQGEDDVIEFFGSNMNMEEETLSARSPRDHFSFLMEEEKNYLQCLERMMSDYQVMYSKTPSLIRQRFDLIFQQLDIIYQFQLVLQKTLQETHGDPQQLARAFSNEQFQYYGRLMVMTPAVQQALIQYASHIKEHFPDLRRDILKPSLRINFYANILNSFKKEAPEEVKAELQSAIDCLNQVKRKANTEMTLSTVVQSPVDLRLGGDMLHIGEFTCTSGGFLQKKKYQLILFENLFVITSKKLPFFKYKTHYRIEQLESVTGVGVNELHLNVLSEGQKQMVTLKFTAKYQKNRDEWINELEKITKHNTRLCRGSNSLTLRVSRQRYRMLPLDLCRVFPLLRAVVDADLEEVESNIEITLQKIKNDEVKYIEILSATLNPEYTRPPGELSDLLEKLYKLHTKQILPAVKRSQTVSDFLDYFVKNLDELAVYVNYLVIRSQLTTELDDVPRAGEYIMPVQRLYGVYFGMMKELCKIDRCRNQALRVIKRLQKHVETAQVRVLEGAVLNGRVDFQRSGKLILYTPLQLKTRRKEIRAGDYTGLLFENVIILTRSKQPYYEYVMDIWLDQANLGRPANHDCTFRLEVRQGRRKEPITYEMTTTSPDMKRLWMRHLQEQLLAQVDKIRQRWVRDV